MSACERCGYSDGLHDADCPNLRNVAFCKVTDDDSSSDGGKLWQKLMDELAAISKADEKALLLERLPDLSDFVEWSSADS